MLTLTTWIRLAGLAHLVVLGAAFAVPRIVNFKDNLAKVTPFMRHLVWVYSAFIALVVAGFGIGSFLHAEALAGGTPLARSICLFIAVFWTLRLVVQFFVYDPAPFRKNRWIIAGYHALTAAFLFFVAAYGAAALCGG